MTPAPEARRPGLVPLEQALGEILARVQPLPAASGQTLPAIEALGRVLAEDLRSTTDVPPADNTAMDGYALRLADCPAPGTVLPVSARIPAGVVPQPLAAGTAARIFTGAPIPPGADAVIMQERCTALPAEAAAGGTGLGAVRIDELPRAGQWIRRRGEDLAAGQVVIAAGTRLTSAALGVSASAGVPQLRVAARPRVALFSTGNELVLPGEPLPPGAIYNCNRTTLRALLLRTGCEVTDLGIVPDTLAATRAALREAAREHDLVLTSGGVSVGEEDHIKPAVQAEGRLTHWQLAMKPGKPLAFGELRRGELAAPEAAPAWFVGLPGNPVSSFVTFVLVVRPILLRLQGARDLAPRRAMLRADFDWPRPDSRREFLRVRLNDAGGLDLFAHQGSGVLSSALWADGLVDLAAGQVVKAGDTVPWLSLHELA